MYISAKAAAESLNTYQSFKDQLLPNIKKGNIAVLYLPETQSSIGFAKKSKRSKTSFDSHNNSRASSATGTNNSTFIQEQISRSRQASRCGGFSRKASKSGDCTPFISIDQNVKVAHPQILLKNATRSTMGLMGNTENCFDENQHQLHPIIPSAGITTKSHITLIDLDDSVRIRENSKPIDRQQVSAKLNNRTNNLSVVDVQGPLPSQPHHHPVLSQQTNRPTFQHQPMMMHDTNQDLNGLLLSIYDQSDVKSQTCNTVTAENQLREENMHLRMEIIKLKKALFMKSQNAVENISALNALNNAQEIRDKSEQILRNHLEPREDSLSTKEQHYQRQTPLSRVVIEDICEEGVSSYSHEDLPRMGHQSHMTFKQIQQSTNSRQYDQEATPAVVTFQPRPPNYHNQSVQALEDLEKMLHDQGIEIRDELLRRNPKDFLLTDERKGLSSVFEQKRHYEQEIEVLKKDLEVIENEEIKIKQRLSEQSSLLMESLKMERGQLKDKNGARQSKDAIQGGQINVAFDSFLEKRSSNQPKFMQAGSSIDKQSINCISDDGVMPTVSINHQNMRQNNANQHPWFPPSFSNSLFPSLAVSPANASNIIPSLQLPQEPQLVLKPRGRRSRYSQRNHQNALYCNDSRSNDASCTSQEDQLPQTSNNQVTQQLQPLSNGQTSSRLNTDMIDQLFEDPKLQSQFQCLDNDQPIISLLNVGNEFPKKNYNNNISMVHSQQQSNDQFIHKKSKERQEQQQPQKLTYIKQTLKGVLQNYEQSFQKINNQQVKHFIGDGTEARLSPKKDFGIPRLSTIKEDSPEFGPFTENSDIVNHSSILRVHQIQNNSQMSNNMNHPCEMCQRKNSSLHRTNAPSFEQNTSKALIKKTSQVKGTKQVSKSPLRPVHSANQIKAKKTTTNFIKVQKEVQQQHPLISRSSSPYNTNQVSNIVNQAYKDIIKRKQREAHEISYISSKANQHAPPMTYAGLAQMTTQHKKNIQMKNNKVLGAAQPKKPKKSKENIKFLSNIVTKFQGSRNIQQNNKVLSANNVNQNTSAVSSYSFISAKGNQPKTPISHPRSLSNQSKQQRPSPVPSQTFHCIDEQYDLLWSKQVTQKRISLLKKKEEAAKQKYQEKIAKIESIQRKKAIEIEERKNKSKSPSNYVPTTTMSDFECTPYYAGVGMKMTIDKGQNHGYNTLQPPTLIPSTSTRSPNLPGTPLARDFMTTNYNQNLHSKPSQPVSITASGITTNLISQQNSARKPIIRSSRTPEVAKGVGSTPATVNKNYWDNHPEMMSAEDQRWHGNLGGAEFNNSSANTTAIVTAINGMNYENVGSLRQKVQYYSNMASPHMHYPVSVRQTVHHSRSNSGQKIVTEKRISHKKQSSLSNPTTQNSNQIDMQMNYRPNETRQNFIQKKQESEMMKQFLSTANNTQSTDQISSMKSGNSTIRVATTNNIYQKPSLLQLHPVKYDGKGQVKTLPLSSANAMTVSHHMRLLEPILEDY